MMAMIWSSDLETAFEKRNFDDDKDAVFRCD